MHSLFKYIRVALGLTFLLSLSFPVISQSPKKYLKNGFYEKAYVEAVYKQNKKVKLKSKHTDVIYKSYALIYKKHSETILSSKTGWLEGYKQLLRVNAFKLKCKHPGVYDNLKNILDDKAILKVLGKKFNEENVEDLKVAESYESVGKYKKALKLYYEIKERHKQAEQISTLEDKIIPIDTEPMLLRAKTSLGDQLIQEARDLLASSSKNDAEKAIERIKEAKIYRELDAEEEELIRLAKLIIGQSFMDEANRLLQTKTKKNARLAYEMINRARSMRTLSTDEEKLLNTAQDLGTTRILIKMKGKIPVHNSKELSGYMNKERGSQWVTYLFERNNEKIDFEMEVGEKQPSIVLGKIRKKVEQNTKTVEYYEEETDADGNPVKVKKTKTVTAMVATLSRTKTATMEWSVSLSDLTDGSIVHSENKESKIEITHEAFALESGDVLALPENIDTDIDLDSQPFPTDEEMTDQIKQAQLKELMKLVNSHKDHMLNIDRVIE